ncbi:MAG: hypothetical protein FWD99_03320 [Oscillospiraceae bacterium]|nr:hypothetical protein [Oscillospiraceae bacterium]
MFHVGLYREALRKSVAIAALFIAIMLLGAILTPVGEISWVREAMARGGRTMPSFIGGLDQNWTLVLAMVVQAPVLTLYLFSFLNKRNSSDFYHSIPHKREALFLSYAAAILTWVIGGIWVCTGIALAIFATGSAYVTVHVGSVLLATLGLTAGCLLVVAATLMAMSITGGRFANIITTGLILFFPRTIMLVFTSIVTFAAPVVSIDSFGFFGSGFYHIPFGMLVSPFIGLFGNVGQGVGFETGIVYTLVLALLYFGAALFLFKRRKSETAQNPAPNRIVQTAIRVAGAFLLCLPAIGFVVEWFTTPRGEPMAVVTFYVIALIGYFAYELITTRKLSNIKKALPGLGILVLLNIVFITGAMTTQHVILNRSLAAHQIQSVRILSLHDRWDPQGQMSYEWQRVRMLAIQDEALTDVLTEALARNVRTIRQSSHNTPEGRQNSVIVFETASGRRIQRNIRLTDTEANDIRRILDQNEAYTAARLTLPENPAELWSGDLSEAAVREIYAVLREEVRGLDIEDWRKVSAARISSCDCCPPVGNVPDDVAHYGDLHVSGFIGRETYFSIYPVTSITPRTADLFVRHTNAESFEDTERILGYVMGGGSVNWLHIRSHGLHNDQQYSIRSNPDRRERAIVGTVLEEVQAQQGAPLDRNRVYYSLNASVHMDGRLVRVSFFFHSDLLESVLGWSDLV